MTKFIALFTLIVMSSAWATEATTDCIYTRDSDGRSVKQIKSDSSESVKDDGVRVE